MQDDGHGFYESHPDIFISLTLDFFNDKTTKY